MSWNEISGELLWIVLFHEAGPVGNIWCGFNGPLLMSDCFVLIEKKHLLSKRDLFSTFNYSDLLVDVSNLTFSASSHKYSSSSFLCVGVGVCGWGLPVCVSILRYLGLGLGERIFFTQCDV